MLEVSNNAINKIYNYITTNKKYKNKSLRVFLKGGGCSGFQYGFAFDSQQDDDNIISTDNTEVQILVDKDSALYLRGAKLDYIEEVDKAGFYIENPNVTGGCGCGSSVSFNKESQTNSTPPCGSGGCC